MSKLLSFPVNFSDRGKYEQLVLGMATVEIGLEKPFSVLHISDTHLTAAYEDESEKTKEIASIRTKTFGGHQEEALADSLAWAKRNCAFVLHTGDLIDFQSRANFDLVKKYFGADAAVRVIGTVGNHDFSPHMWLTDPPEERTEVFKDRSRATLQAVYPFDIGFNAQVVNGVNFVLIDNVYATVTPAQVSRFEEEVAKGFPIVLAMHVPIFTDGLWRMTARFWQSMNVPFANGAIPENSGERRDQQEDSTTVAFIERLRREPLLKAVLTGHNHFAAAERFSPTAMQYVVGPNFMFHGQEILFV